MTYKLFGAMLCLSAAGEVMVILYTKHNRRHCEERKGPFLTTKYSNIIRTLIFTDGGWTDVRE